MKELPELKILFLADRPPERMEPYMRNDLETLRDIGRVTWLNPMPRIAWRRPLGPTGWLPSARTLSFVAHSDLVFQWFAVPSGPAVAARLTGTPILTVAGGYDTARLSAIGYGRMVGLRTRAMGMLALRLSTRVLGISRHAAIEIERAAPRARVEVVYPGLCISRYTDPAAKRAQVVTIGTVSREYLLRKGLLTFAETSRLLPDIPFLLVGRIVDPNVAAQLRAVGGENLRLLGYLSDGELTDTLAASAVYAQLSLHEGFGYAVAEAMLCGCTPVVTSAGALEEVVGPHGLVVAPRRPDKAASAIRAALTRGDEPRRCRQWVADHFSNEARARALARIVHETLQQ